MSSDETMPMGMALWGFFTSSPREHRRWLSSDYWRQNLHVCCLFMAPYALTFNLLDAISRHTNIHSTYVACVLLPLHILNWNAQLLQLQAITQLTSLGQTLSYCAAEGTRRVTSTQHWLQSLSYATSTRLASLVGLDSWPEMSSWGSRAGARQSDFSKSRGGAGREVTEENWKEKLVILPRVLEFLPERTPSAASYQVI